ncbi:protein-disulfide reductase DsbD domain-containing protein [Afifella marina]|uniref:Thiol-disulfide interchange protein, contains DsbC and DsbD domains n=1 Tax=Afifella marina DSM 2698 TaxID=1120955 RepID=A0A1G5M9M6_AFIMA|nr:protein-disulfide reductase DsbD domain-containing protein [Afifella marina]SCZ21796.1 Thiol-disulfide interchange protein, contains DsbC and DsbD domains [Afifella marina DSM 2698]
MQRRFFLPSVIASLIASLALAVFVGEATAAQSNWSDGERSRLRLIAAPVDGEAMAGIEIELEPGWHTYWRSPGDVGIPPRFDFSGSQNLRAARVLYPAPERYDDGTSISAVYFDRTALPVLVTADDPAKPVVLKLSAFYGVCKDVCIPADGAATLTIDPQPKDDPRARIALKEAVAELPQQGPAPGLAIERPQRDGSDVTIPVVAEGAPKHAPVLFAEAPDGAYLPVPELGPHEGANFIYHLRFSNAEEAAALSGKEIRFTLVSGGEAIEQSMKLP